MDVVVQRDLPALQLDAAERLEGGPVAELEDVGISIAGVAE